MKNNVSIKQYKAKYWLENKIKILNKRKKIKHKKNKQKKVIGHKEPAFYFNRDNLDLSGAEPHYFGDMTNTCDDCGAKKWKEETKLQCCQHGKIQLTPHILNHPIKLKNCLLMTMN